MSVKNSIKQLKASIYLRANAINKQYEFVNKAIDTLAGKIALGAGSSGLTMGLADQPILSVGLLSIATISGLIAVKKTHASIENKKERQQMGATKKSLMFATLLGGIAMVSMANTGQGVVHNTLKTGSITIEQNVLSQKTDNFLKLLNEAEKNNIHRDKILVMTDKIDDRLEQKKTFLKEQLQKESKEIQEELVKYEQNSKKYEPLGYKNIPVIALSLLTTKGTKDVLITRAEFAPIEKLVKIVSDVNFQLDNLKEEKIPASISSLDNPS